MLLPKSIVGKGTFVGGKTCICGMMSFICDQEGMANLSIWSTSCI